MNSPIFILFCVLGVVFIIRFLLICRRNKAADACFGIKMSGGRGGVLEYRNSGRIAKIQWEMLVGEFDLVVYARELFWSGKEHRAFTTDERKQFFSALNAWAAAHRYKIDLDAPEATELKS